MEQEDGGEEEDQENETFYNNNNLEGHPNYRGINVLNGMIMKVSYEDYWPQEGEIMNFHFIIR